MLSRMIYDSKNLNIVSEWVSEWMSEWVLFNAKSNEQVNFQWDDDEVCFVLEKYV